MRSPSRRVAISAALAVILAFPNSAHAVNSRWSISDGSPCKTNQLGITKSIQNLIYVCKRTPKGSRWKVIAQSSVQNTQPSTSTSTSTTLAPKTYTGSTDWGLVTLTGIYAPRQGQCAEIPIRVEIRGKVGLGFGLIISAEDNYQNPLGEMQRLTTDEQLALGVKDYTIRVCGDPWVLTYQSGVTLSLSPVKYCGVKIKFFPYQRPITYIFADC